MPASSLVELFPISQPAISRHLRILRETGLVEAATTEEDRRVRVYRLNASPLREVETWLQRFWQRQLNAFARYVEDQP